MNECVCGETVSLELDIQALYRHSIRKNWASIGGQKYQAKAIDVELNLAEPKEPEQWIKVRLLFVRGNAGETQASAGKHDWAVFLTTATALSPAEMLELYSFRQALASFSGVDHRGFGWLESRLG